ncbi:MAG TPA: hypothetical protein VIH61_03765 [Waddliaceae bacterium]
MYQIIAQHEKVQKRKYNFDLIGSGGGIPDYVTNFSLHYVSTNQVDMLKTRKMFVNNVEDLLQLINSNEQIRPYLSNYPFTINNLEFRISFQDRFGKRQEPPYVALVSLINERIFYSFYDLSTRQFIGKDYSEPYSEARKMVLGEDPIVTDCSVK